jgi:hypothetical protein
MDRLEFYNKYLIGETFKVYGTSTIYTFGKLKDNNIIDIHWVDNGEIIHAANGYTINIIFKYLTDKTWLVSIQNYRRIKLYIIRNND